MLEIPLPQSQLKTHHVSDDAPETALIDSKPTVSTLNYLTENDVFDLLWLAFDSKQAVQGVFNVQGAVAAGKAEFVVFAWQNLMMKDHLRDVIEQRTWQLCKERQVPTFFVSSMYFLGHGCGFDYAIRAVAVTFQEGSELTNEIKDMKRRIQRLRSILYDSEAEESIDSDTLEGHLDESEDENHMDTVALGSKPGDLEHEEAILIENLSGKPADTEAEEAGRSSFLENKLHDIEVQDPACSEILSGKPDGLEAEMSASIGVLERRPSDLEAIQPVHADNFGILSEASEFAHSTRTDSFEYLKCIKHVGRV
ncbi:NHP2-like protein 1 [Colletotrichum scovillei]|uniref:NHP2-like protein 1 n=1 Tax=Colletotrichum scovillei TaxID=1209932 RepID=A0A9P7UHH0_9PEZI|nr:NHP2-like protein 1 [Colletotrichum scovillei]KAG7075923.1 NHP2-like protein 1 [Colletotrichum scovillei]KAG7083100.1 NHP2-like protein 1 [Colletotrichum scovillei]